MIVDTESELVGMTLLDGAADPGKHAPAPGTVLAPAPGVMPAPALGTVPAPSPALGTVPALGTDLSPGPTLGRLDPPLAPAPGPGLAPEPVAAAAIVPAPGRLQVRDSDLAPGRCQARALHRDDNGRARGRTVWSPIHVTPLVYPSAGRTEYIKLTSVL